MTVARFDSFAILAGMRTGSNLLEETVNAHKALCCHGELFNPHFVGYPKRDEALGITRAARNEDPVKLIDAVKAEPGLAGFRLFDGHDGRALDHVLQDPRCAKILLTRNPLESFVSLKIARTTKQWWLGDAKRKRSASVDFNTSEFNAFLADTEAFRTHIRRSLLSSGQTAFSLRYEDLSDPDLIGGMFRFLGVDAIAPPARPRGKVQNPEPITAKVSNPDQMREALANLDPFDLDRIPDFEPARGVGAKGILVAATAPVMVLPVGGILRQGLSNWLAELSDGAIPQTGLNQRQLRVWMRERPGHRVVAVVEHPVARAFEVYRRRVITGNDGALCDLLRKDFDLPHVLEGSALKAGFLAYLTFVRGTLTGRPDTISIPTGPRRPRSSKAMRGCGCPMSSCARTVWTGVSPRCAPSLG